MLSICAPSAASLLGIRECSKACNCCAAACKPHQASRDRAAACGTCRACAPVCSPSLGGHQCSLPCLCSSDAKPGQAASRRQSPSRVWPASGWAQVRPGQHFVQGIGEGFSVCMHFEPSKRGKQVARPKPDLADPMLSLPCAALHPGDWGGLHRARAPGPLARDQRGHQVPGPSAGQARAQC